MSLALSPVTAAGRALLGSVRPPPARLDAATLRPYVGILGVLLGALMSVLGSRISSFGLADLRGGLHAGFDEGAWITTSFGIGQMVVGIAAPYLSSIFGVRRVLLWGITLFFVASLIGPLSPNLQAFLAAQFLAGLGSGTFVPLTIGFILRSLPARLVIYGVAIYAMNTELSLNIGASLEGWYAENWTWHWVLWQYCALLPLMFACIWYGVPREPIRMDLLHDLDWPGMVYAMMGFGLLYAGLDQGNRLDWTNNGLVNGLLIGGVTLTALFVAREFVTARPFLNLRLIARGNLPLLLLALAGFRFIILSTAYVIPVYLQTVQNFRELQVGSVLLWIALPQILFVLPLGYVLSKHDGRGLLAFGAIVVCVACLMGTRLTSEWVTRDFLPSQLVQAIGQSCALTAVVALAVRTINPADAISIGTMLQTARLFGGEIGTAFMQTWVRMREQVHSNLLGLHVDASTALTTDRLQAYSSAMSAHVSDLAVASAQGVRALSAAVMQQASVLAYIDGFLATAVGAYVCLMLAAAMRKPPPSPF